MTDTTPSPSQPDGQAIPEPGAAATGSTAGHPLQRVPLGRFLRYFLGLGTWGFGGPIATVGYMQRDLVERRAWISRDDFLDGVALGQAMPGPLAAQVVMWFGFLRAGIAGAAVTAAVFIAPSFALVLALAVVYARYQGLPVVQALFYGIAPAVMAVIAVAAVKLARLTNRRDTRLWVISVVLAVVTAATGAEIAVLFLAAGLLMVVWDAPPPPTRSPHRLRYSPCPSWPPRPPAVGSCSRWAGSSSRPARSSSAAAWPSCRSCARASCTTTTGSPTPSSSTPSPWD
jgi:chromate transporter